MSGSHIKSQGIRNTCICLNSDSLSHRSFSSIHSCKINRNKSLDLQYIMLKTLLFWFLLSKHTELRIMSTQMFTSVVLFVCLCFVCVALLRFLFVIVIFLPHTWCPHTNTRMSAFQYEWLVLFMQIHWTIPYMSLLLWNTSHSNVSFENVLFYIYTKLTI
jgi:hypothetical protein